MEIDSYLSYKSVISKRKEIQTSLKKQTWVLQKYKLSGNAKLQVWHSLHRAKWAYATEMLVCDSAEVRRWLKSAWYNALRTIFHVNNKVAMD